VGWKAEHLALPRPFRGWVESPPTLVSAVAKRDFAKQRQRPRMGRWSPIDSLQRQNVCTNPRQFGAIHTEPGNLCLLRTAWWGREKCQDLTAPTTYWGVRAKSPHWYAIRVRLSSLTCARTSLIATPSLRGP